MDLGGWLRSLGLERYEGAFRENEIDETVLPNLTAEDLKELGVSALGHRRKLLDAIASFRADGGSKATQRQSAPACTADLIGPANIAPQKEVVGERRYLTVMFCDLVGSTGIAAKLDAEEWRDLVGGYLDAAPAAVTEMGGHVAKKLGDGLMALFGYPVAQENDAERAVRAALAIQRALAELNRKNAASGKPELIARIGLEPARRWWTRRARFTATSPTLRRGCRRWPSRARFWSRRGCGARSLACSSPRSVARTRSRVYPNRRHCSGLRARAEAAAARRSAI
jgi:SAM domain (Sterile alpha motif)/Adenylate and Guanylate cyclase catalytic domain